jgi:hypothetical protein
MWHSRDMSTEVVGPVQGCRETESVQASSTSDTTEKVVGNIDDFLQQMILQMTPNEAEARWREPGRPRVLPSLALWAGMLVCVLHGFSSQLAVWRLLSERQLWFYPRFPVSDQAVYNRLQREGTGPLVKLFCQISLVLRERLTPFADMTLAPFAKEVMALDESALDQVARLLPTLRDVPKGDNRLLPGKIAGLFDIRRQQWWQVQHIENPDQNEKVAARGLISGLCKGSLILADLGYFGFAWFDHLTDQGYHWISRLRSKTSYSPVLTYYHNGETFDGLIWLGAYRADKAAHAVRLVRFRVGTCLYSYVTNVLDPQLLPMAEIARLYARRWDFELAVKLIKRHLKLHILWSAKDVVILQQVWAVLIISQVLQALRVEIAGRAEVDVFDVSMALLVEYAPHYAYYGEDPVEVFVNQGRELRFIRPSTRTVIQAPVIDPAQMVPLPPDLVLVREPRYAQRNCGSRKLPAHS